MNDTIAGSDPLRLKQFGLASLGIIVLGSPSAFALWLSSPERKELFTTEDGADTLREQLKELDRGVW